MQLRDRFEELEARGLEAVALALEETDATHTGRFLAKLGGEVPFPLLSDVGRQQASGCEPTTVYLMDEEGVVQQVFPMLTYSRGSWSAILREADRLLAEDS